MNTLFIYNEPVSGRDFIGRRKDIDLICNLLTTGDSLVVYGEPGVGCKSLVMESLTRLRRHMSDFLVADIDLMRVRTTEDVLLQFADGIIKSCASSPSQYREIVEESLQGTHFVFDQEIYDKAGTVVSLNWLPDEIDMAKVFELPSALSSMRHSRIVLLVRQFQNVLFSEDSDLILRSLEKVVERRDADCPFVFIGSQYNRLREIFDEKRYFWRSVFRLVPSKVDPLQIAEYVYSRFQAYGKVLQRDIVSSTAELLRCNLKYVNHLFSLVDSIAKGYITPNSITDSLSVMLSIYRPGFLRNVYGLTDFQLRMLKAIVDGETRFSAASVIDRYRLNSSANVKRLKDALVKKELVWFDDQDMPHIQDALFEYWLRKEYFAD